MRPAVFALASIKPGDSCPCVSHRPGCPYLNPAHEDAKLTQRGRLQATAVGSKLIFTKPVPEIALISPLYRTLQTATIALSTVSHLQISLVAEEQIRERMGMHICDKRSDKEKLVNYFKNVDFSNIAPGPDVLYSQRCETPEQVAKRGKQFFLTLKDRPETSILLVTHSSFLFNTLSRSFITPDPKGKRFQIFS